MQNARTATKLIAALAISCLSAALLSSSEVRAAAGGIQNCTSGATCVIGEFLYDDNSSPINDATCQIVSFDPSDSEYLNTATDTPTQSDGWYSKTFTAPATTGFYRTTITCTVLGDSLSIDKSFQVVEAPATDPNAVATAVWGFSGKTLDSWGTLPSEIWSYSSRTLSSIADIVSGIWSSTTRTLTGAGLDSGQLATKSDTDALSTQISNISGGTSTTTNTTNITNVTNTTDNAVVDTINQIKTVADQNRLLLEQVVNKPIIQNVLEDTSPKISEKIQDTRSMANQVYVNSQYLTSQSAIVGSNWNTADGKDLLASILELSGVLGEEGDSSSTDTIFGQMNWIRDSWNWDEVTNIYNQLLASQKIMQDLRSGLADYQKTPAMYTEMKNLVSNFVAIEKVVGTTTDTSTQSTLFGRIRSTEALASTLDAKGVDVDKVLAEYNTKGSSPSLLSEITDLQNQVIAINKVPGIIGALVKITPTDPNSIQNLLLGLKGVITSNQKLLSLGSDKTLVNSWLEVGSIIIKTIITNPSKLISQDAQIKYYLPSELKQENIIKTDAGLSVNYDIEKGQLYVEGTVKLSPGQTRTFTVETTDIWSYSKDELDSLRNQANSLSLPLEKTAYYAQGVTLKSDIDATLDQMTTIQTSALTPEEKIQAYRQNVILKNSIDTKMTAMKDLVTLASANKSMLGFVGGSQTLAVWGIVVVVVGGFILMTVFIKNAMKKPKVPKVPLSTPTEMPVTSNPAIHKGIKPAALISMLVFVSILSAATSGIIATKLASKNYEDKTPVLGTETINNAPATNQIDENIKPSSEPTLDNMSDGTGGQYIVIIGDTPTGFLSVKNSPDGTDIAHAETNSKIIYLDEQPGWYKIQLEDGTVGWVSSQYSSKE